MRLLNIYSLELHEFTENAPPPYFILSHRWHGKETSYEDLITGRSVGTTGYQKIEELCAFSIIQSEDADAHVLFGHANIEWVWIDTCCIDKRSSAELSEAINSMNDWYQRSAACFVYLNDVTVNDVDQDQRKSFMESSWFLRGWTLQELLAPDRLVFCNAQWDVIGCMGAPRERQSRHDLDKFESKYTPVLRDTVSSTTGIRPAYLGNLYRMGPNSASVAERLAWAARRKTTRIEDQAYCLLGIFGIHMPLLYGEGSRAFLRLQQAIVQQSTDKSIFAWTLPAGTGMSCEKLFAPNPSHFEMKAAYMAHSYDEGLETALTNRGLRIRAQAVKISAQEFNQKAWAVGGRSIFQATTDVFFLTFKGKFFGYAGPSLILGLARKDDSPQPNQYVRICTEDMGEEFEELFTLSSRASEPKQSFFIDT